MRKFFNTAGPCVPEDHYTLPNDFTQMRKLIDDQRYFILHAPRQTGKTTMMLELMRRLNAEGKYIALYVNIEAAQPLRNKTQAVNQVAMSCIEINAKVYLDPSLRPSESCFATRAPDSGLAEFLANWCLELPKPLVLFVDEVDALIGDGLISVLRQLRGGYTNRPKAFPHSLCLIGLRDVRDYRIYSDSSQRYIIGGSAFNIKEKSIRLADFTLEQVKDLYAQHTAATGQLFTREAVERVFYWSQGQPWLVNALGRELCFDDFALPVDHTILPEDVDNAAEILIQRRDVHLDQLADKLTEPRVARIIEKILVGEEEEQPLDEKTHAEINENQQYLLDLGLVRLGRDGLEIANPLYREVIPRELTWYRQNMLGQNPEWYVKPDGKLDMPKVLTAYVEFYREHRDLVTKRQTYNEAAHHLLLTAWLQRIVNGGGRITREYAVGLGRMDLCIDFAGERFAIELKLSGKKAREKGLDQLAGYLEKLSLPSGWLIIFSRHPQTPETAGQREMTDYNNKQIEIIWL